MGLGDSAMTVVAILLAAILMFVFPLMMTADNNEDVTNLKVEQLTTDFTDTMRVTGKLTQEDYDNFVVNLAATGNAYDVQIEVQRLDENLAKKNYGTTVTIGDNVYYTEYTAQILDELANNKQRVTYFSEGDIVTVSVESGPSLAQTLKNIWFKIFGKELTPVAKSTGMVTTKGN